MRNRIGYGQKGCKTLHRVKNVMKNGYREYGGAREALPLERGKGWG